jgi:hypothetical protein
MKRILAALAFVLETLWGDWKFGLILPNHTHDFAH